jgi:hypothetical protein
MLKFTMAELDFEMDIDSMEEVVTSMEVEQQGEIECRKCLICDSDCEGDMQRLDRGLPSFLQQCKSLGRLDLVGYIECNQSKPLHLHKSCWQKWLKLLSKSSKQAEQVVKKRSTRKTSLKLDFETICFFALKVQKTVRLMILGTCLL